MSRWLPPGTRPLLNIEGFVAPPRPLNQFQSPSISKLDILKQFYCRCWKERSCPKRSSTSTRICSDDCGPSSVRTPPRRTPSTPHCPNGGPSTKKGPPPAASCRENLRPVPLPRGSVPPPAGEPL